MPKCCVALCPNSVKKTTGIPLFSFPTDKRVREKWLRAVKIDASKTLDDTYRVCFEHFEEEDVFRFNTKTQLKPKRIPHRNLGQEIRQRGHEADEIATSVVVETRPLLSLKIQKKKCITRISTKPPFAIENFWKNDKKICKYTGIQRHAILIALYNFILKSEKGEKGVVHVTRSKSSRISCHKLSPLNELFLTLIKLRKAIDYHMLGDMFWISESAACRIFNVWINLLYMKLGGLNIFPHRDVLIANAPVGFTEKYPKVMGSIDCTEFLIETPSSLVRQSQCFSNYKGTNTLKSLIMINSNGGIVFVSALHTGSISDKQLVQDSGFLKLLRKKVAIGELEVGDIILGDKGFNIHNLLQDVGLELNIPTFRISGMQFTPDEVQQIRKIAHERVHVERAIRRLKMFKLLCNKIPISLLGLINQIYTVCALLTNLRYPLRS